MVLFLSTSLTERLQADLLAGGYPGNTPVAVVYKATWPEEQIFRCTVETLHKYLRSLLYHPGFTTEYREATE